MPPLRTLDVRAIELDDTSSVADTNISGSSENRRKKLRKGLNMGRQRQEELEKLAERFEYITVRDEGKKFRNVKEKVKFGEMDPVWAEFVGDCPDAVPQWFNADDYTMFLANDAAQMDHLKQFDRPPLERLWSDEAAFDRAWDWVSLLLEPDEPLVFPTLSDLKNVPYKKSKYPGYNYRADGYKDRHHANEAAQADAERAWLRLMDGEAVAPHYVRLGGRGKVKKGKAAHHKAMGTVAGRLILMLSQRDLKLLGNTEKIATASCCDAENPIYVGKSWFCGGSTRFVKALQGYTKFYCLDARKYDASLDPYMIRRAVHLMRGWFADGYASEYDTYWEFVVQTLLEAPIMRDDGFCLRKKVGTTSGHSHNTLLQSIVTLVLGYACIIALNPTIDPVVVVQNCVVFSLGDDNLIAIRSPLRDVTVEEIAGIALRSANVDWTGDKSFATERLVDPIGQDQANVEGGEFGGVQFLGKYFKIVTYEVEGITYDVIVPHRPAWESLIKLAVPEKPPSRRAQELYSVYQLAYMRAVGIYIDGASNHWTRSVCDSYLDWLELKGGQAYVKPDLKMNAKLFGWGELEDEEEYLLRRFTWDDWMTLVVMDKAEAKERLVHGWRAELEVS